jgi:glucose-6-phosphate dehydrogenase assembly protein OpcA
MPTAAADAFLQGQGIPVGLDQIETELIRLWGPAAERVGGPHLEQPTVTRVVLANLVVFVNEAREGRLDEVLDTVVARYPCRAIVMRQTNDSERKVSAEVSALCHLPAPGLPQVCSERIVLKAGPQALDLLPGAVRSLLEADLPFVLWWTEDPRATEELYFDLGDECSRLILDLPDPGTEAKALRVGLNLEKIPFARDLAWFGITRWRELVAQFFDVSCREGALKRITALDIHALAPSDEVPPRTAAWLAAWLAGQLGWEPEGHPAMARGRLEASFRGPSGPVPIAIHTTLDRGMDFACLTGVTLSVGGPRGEETYRLQRPNSGAEGIRIAVESPRACVPPQLVHAPTFDLARRVAAALESSRSDPPFRRALPHALWLLEG